MEKIYDCVVVGSGPAGLTAAIYLSRGAAKTLVLAGSAWGGQLMITSEVENFPGFPEGVMGPELMSKMKAQAEKFGVEFQALDVESVNFSTFPFEFRNSGFVFKARSAVIATGAQTVWLDAPGVKEFIGRGISSCAPCDAPFFKDKKVVVVGGGDSAMEEAVMLTKFATEVIIVHRRNEFRASPIMQTKVKTNSKIKILFNTEIVEIKGEGKVSAVTLKNNQDNNVSTVPVDGVFMAIGHKPASEIFKGQLELNEAGFIKIVKPHSVTSVPGVFVAGDVADPYYKQAITAAGSGCAAALDTLKYLEENNQHG